MSAIAGIYHFKNEAASKTDLENLNLAMHQHGQDGSAIWFEKNIGLAQQTTHLTLESLNQQLPYFDPQHQLAIAADCRLFNRAQLCEKLSLQNDVSLADSQIILFAYLKWQKNFVQHLIGEFSIALWDAAREQLICATDHFNSRPIFYYHDAKLFAFASEITALHRLPGVARLPNLHKIARHDFLRVQLFPGETCFANIKFLPARSLLMVSRKGVEIEQYWQPCLEKEFNFSSDDAFREAFQHVFSSSIQAVTRSNHSVSLMLSGGLDSSAIAMMTAKQFAKENRQLICLSNVLPENQSGKDESHFINLLAHPALQKHSVTDAWRGPFDELASFAECLEFNPQHYQYRAIHEMARKNQARILLHGTLGELSASYYGREYLAHLFKTLRWIHLMKEMTAYKKNYQTSFASIIKSFVVLPNLPKAWQSYISRNNQKEILKQSIMRQDFIASHVDENQFEALRKSFLNNTTNVTDCRKNNLAQLNWFLQHIEPGFGSLRDSTATALAVSNPYFDKRFVEFCLRLPNKYRLQNGYSRNIIRSGMMGVMPQEICQRICKEPFLPDYHQRYNQQLPQARAAVEELSKNSLVREVIDVQRLKQFLQYESDSPRLNGENNFINFMVIPRAIYLAKFLASFD